jgi:hypothetical protein
MYFLVSNFTDTMELEFVGYELKEPKYTHWKKRVRMMQLLSTNLCDFPSW